MDKRGDSSYQPIWPKITAISGELKPYFEVKPSFFIYSLTGPSVPVRGYVKFAGTDETNISFKNTCHDTDGISAAVYAGFDVHFGWEISKDIKKLLAKDDETWHVEKSWSSISGTANGSFTGKISAAAPVLRPLWRLQERILTVLLY